MTASASWILVRRAVLVLGLVLIGARWWWTEREEPARSWPAAPVAALGGSPATMKARLNGYALEYALTVTADADEALVAAQGDRGFAFRFLDAAGESVISSRVPSWGLQADRASDGSVTHLSLRGVERCTATEFRRIAGWALVPAPR